MPASDYTQSGGGALKLKGSAGVDKKRKKKKPRPEAADEAKHENEPKPDTLPSRQDGPTKDVDKAIDEVGSDGEGKASETTSDNGPTRIKTEAERKFEERRRKRLDEKMKRDGSKTHKERVEELNRYLSNLSEHHDMPRIGPG